MEEKHLRWKLAKRQRAVLPCAFTNNDIKHFKSNRKRGLPSRIQRREVSWRSEDEQEQLERIQNEDRVERTEGQTKMDSIEETAEQLPTLDEVMSWSRSFEKMMHSPEGRNTFSQFLRSEYSEENLLFWLACEALKAETSRTAIDQKARIIYEDYVSILSPKEVSLDSRVRESIHRSLAEPSREMYEEAQLQIYTLMHRDSYPRFLSSSFYRELLESRRSTCLET